MLFSGVCEWRVFGCGAEIKGWGCQTRQKPVTDCFSPTLKSPDGNYVWGDGSVWGPDLCFFFFLFFFLVFSSSSSSLAVEGIFTTVPVHQHTRSHRLPTRCHASDRVVRCNPIPNYHLINLTELRLSLHECRGLWLGECLPVFVPSLKPLSRLSSQGFFYLLI